MKYEIGDIMYNPYFGDVWIVSSRYNEEKKMSCILKNLFMI